MCPNGCDRERDLGTSPTEAGFVCSTTERVVGDSGRTEVHEQLGGRALAVNISWSEDEASDLEEEHLGNITSIKSDDSHYVRIERLKILYG